LCWFFLLPNAGAQSRKELEDKRLKLVQEINQTNQKLQETQKNKAATLDRYIALRSQVKKRQQLVATMQEEITHADSAIARSELVMGALSEDIARLRNEYAQMLRTAWRLRLQQSHLAFILSSKSLNQALKRRQYVRQYERYRRRQAKLIEETQEMLSNKIAQLEKRKQEQRNLIVSVEEQTELLRGEMVNKDKALQSLKADEGRLVKDLERREKERERFSAAIEQIIRNEMAQKRKEARTAPPPRKITSPAPASRDDSPEPAAAIADNSCCWALRTHQSHIRAAAASHPQRRHRTQQRRGHQRFSRFGGQRRTCGQGGRRAVHSGLSKHGHRATWRVLHGLF